MANKITISSNQNKYGNRPGRSHGTGDDQLTQALRNAVSERTGTANKGRPGTSALLLDENVWGNDRAIIDKLDKEVLAERRLFVRVRHVQKITCDSVYEAIDKEPVELRNPLDLTVVDLSVAGIGIICDKEIETGRILGIRILLDRIPYEIKCKVIYCIPLDGKFRAGLKIAEKDKRFMRHLKIFVARTSLTTQYASGE